MKMMDLAGQKFGRWAVLRRAENTAQGQARWLCRCECGTERELKSIVIRKGISQSCGCLKSEVTTARNTKHGHTSYAGCSPTYHSWSGMMARCNNPNHQHYRLYGGRGIKVCRQWREFANFLADMGEKPEGTSLDRIDNNKGYSPQNCRWAQIKVQARNRSDNKHLTLDGVTRTIAEWAELLHVPPASLSWRVNAGWSDKAVLTEPFIAMNQRGQPIKRKLA